MYTHHRVCDNIYIYIYIIYIYIYIYNHLLCNVYIRYPVARM